MKAPASRIQALFSAYHSSSASDRRDQLIRLHIGLVRKVLYQNRHQLSGEGDSLEAIAIQGLAHAIDAYRPGQRQSFSHFAIPYIRRELQLYAQAGRCLQTPMTSLTVSETRLCS